MIHCFPILVTNVGSLWFLPN